MEKLELIPNESLGMFVLGDNIDKYLILPHTVDHMGCESLYSYDGYEFPEQYVSVWVENKKIDFIICDICCYWQNENLIGMTYDHFLSLIGGQCPDNEDICYVPVSRERGQNQKVYNFKSIGLQVWVWRNKIKTIIVSKETLEDE
ncbi:MULTISPECIES: hypothetical protein [Bacteroidaceae]|jgi:hypothetical protein|uniref:Uncharacterized protein n=2 Tax=Bacteroides acidifaciens TaxID=85831 RepID=A0A4S2ALI2_9BACE|nr:MULTISPECIES: hypothetical protein [Bacteroidaceae]MBF0730970.1 hypothetical protein [Bacteroides acidifaciens]MBF0836702.1 hypothetical protein [Bacteroides acidifaciens]NDO54757.1 hypothetical protein [Bacteroides acidifaciens]TFU46887.1 hypothetical protein E4T97_16005 [Bacteroides acidifaciens]TGY01224.1 hypothetical protein E5356_13625 [Bacteroides acidifaciens]